MVKQELKLDLNYYENVIIYKALTDGVYLASIVDVLIPDYINNKHIKRIYNILVTYFNNNDRTPTLTELKAYLPEHSDKDAFAYVLQQMKLIDKNISTDELYINTERFIKERAVYSTIISVGKDVASGVVDTSKILNEFEKKCNICLTPSFGVDLFRDADQFINDLTSETTFIKSGWKWHDDLCGGFAERGRALYVYAGATNVGKSIVLGNVATNIAKQGKNVVVISLEMSELLYCQRLCSSVTQVPMNSLKLNIGSLKPMLEEVHNNTKGTVIVKEFPPTTMTPKQVYAFLKKMTQHGVKIDAVCIDYLNLLTLPNYDSYERVKLITEQLRALTYMLSCPIITATQLNRSGMQNANPDITTLSESYGVGSTADVINYISQTDEERELNVIRIGNMKNRFGLRGTSTLLNIDYSTLTITDMSAEQQNTLNEATESDVTDIEETMRLFT